MRVFALSDIHVDYDVNAQWIRNLSRADYQDDVLILAGDVTHKLPELAACLDSLVARFEKVLFVPGNHDIWVLGEDRAKTSLQKFAEVAATVAASGASMQPFATGDVLIMPLLGWYDYSFGEPSEDLQQIWMDYSACRWPADFGAAEVATYFASLNPQLAPRDAVKVITFSISCRASTWCRRSCLGNIACWIRCWAARGWIGSCASSSRACMFTVTATSIAGCALTE